MSDWLSVRLLDYGLALRADPDRVRATWADPDAVVVGVGDAAIGVGPDGVLDVRATSGEYDPERHYLLGLIEGRPWFATRSDDGNLPSLRSVMDGLAAAELQAAFAAVGLSGWHARARYCPECGQPTRVSAAGQARQCTGCGRELYPRTDPAVIVAIRDAEDRLLLGRQPSWAPGRHSVFAGFVEVGESLEQAVHREMAEEVGLALTDITYFGSQPWPFPRSLMVGFVARTAGTDVTIADGEIETARWFTPDGLLAAMDAGEIGLPPQTSIARRMIEAWLAGQLTS